jgi:hypothetical protein
MLRPFGPSGRLASAVNQPKHTQAGDHTSQPTYCLSVTPTEFGEALIDNSKSTMQELN